MNEIIVSIVIPTYNAEDFLREMINSIVCQTYKNWELLIVDDGSVDGTNSMIAEFGNDQRIKYYPRPIELEKGAQSCRNYGRNLAKGQYICFFDADDLLSPTCLEERVAGILENNTDMYITPAAIFKNSVSDSSWSRLGRYSGEDPLKSFLSHYHQFNVWTNIFKKDSIENILWDPKIRVFQDLDFSMACLFNGLSYSFSKSDDPTYFYRYEYSEQSISSKKATPEKVESTIYMFNKYLDYIDKTERRVEYRKDFIQFHIYYYSQVAKTGDRILIKKLEKHVCDRYNSYVLFVFKLTKPLYKLTDNNRILRLITMLFYYTLLRPSGLIEMITRFYMNIYRKRVNV